MRKWSYTLADFPGLVAKLRVYEDMDPTSSVTEVYAPCCGRRTTAESVIDVRSIPKTIVRGGGIFEPQDHGWLCDGCQFRLIADTQNDWSSSKLLAARGAPASLVNEHMAREWYETADIETYRRRGSIEPVALHEQLEEQVVHVHKQAALAEAEALLART